MNWDKRRQLAVDITTRLSPADLAGVLTRIYKFPQTKVQECMQKGSIHMDCLIDLDTFDQRLLRQLREYVDTCCLVGHSVSKECVICEGLWACGDVISCGNDSCNTRVHEECFGVVGRQYRDGPWLCPSCNAGQDLICTICLGRNGALKRTTDGRWAHILCALVIPETTFSDVAILEPIDGLNDINNSRFRYLCNICKQRGGACVVCETNQCNVGFHPQCAADAGLLVGTELNPVALFCDKHLPEDRVPFAKRWISEDDCLPELQKEENLETAYEILYEDLYPDPIQFIENGNIPIERKLENIVPTKGLISNNRPKSPNRTGDLGPEFPRGKELIGSIVEVRRREDNNWYRGIVKEWSSRNRNYRVFYFEEEFEEWVRLRPPTCRVFQLLQERTSPKGITIKLVKKNSMWVFKEHFFVDSLSSYQGTRKSSSGVQQSFTF